MYHACMHTRPPARLARRAAAPPPKVALLAPEDNQSSAKALEPTGTSYEIETAPGEMAVKGQAWLVESDGFPLP